MLRVEIDDEEVRAGYTSFYKLMNNLPSAQKTIHQKELLKIGRVIGTLKFHSTLLRKPKRRTDKPTSKKEDPPQNG